MVVAGLGEREEEEGGERKLVTAAEMPMVLE